MPRRKPGIIRTTRLDEAAEVTPTQAHLSLSNSAGADQDEGGGRRQKRPNALRGLLDRIGDDDDDSAPI